MRRCRWSLGGEGGSLCVVLARMHRRLMACGSVLKYGGRPVPSHVPWHTESSRGLEHSKTLSRRWRPRANASAVRLGVRAASLGATPLSLAGGHAMAGEHSAPRESAAALAGRITGCGQTPRYTPRKRCRRCRLAPCICATAVQDAGALAGGLELPVALAWRLSLLACSCGG